MLLFSLFQCIVVCDNSQWLIKYIKTNLWLLEFSIPDFTLNSLLLQKCQLNQEPRILQAIIKSM